MILSLPRQARHRAERQVFTDTPIDTSLAATPAVQIPPWARWVDWYVDVTDNTGGAPDTTEIDGYIDCRGNPLGAWRELPVEEISSGVADQYDYNWKRTGVGTTEYLKITVPAEGAEQRLRYKGNGTPHAGSTVVVAVVIR